MTAAEASAPGAVLVVGAGGLGCPAALALARAGVGRITLMDGDRVEPTNLHRQLLHRTEDVGRKKAESGAEALRRAFPQLDVQARAEHLDAANGTALFRAHQVVLDATDDPGVKALLSDMAVSTRTPLIHGGVLRFAGMAFVIRPGGPCLRCLFREPPSAHEAQSCAQSGVLGSVAGVVGALQAQLALDVLRGVDDGAGEGAAWLYRFDGRALQSHRARLERDEECPACRSAPRHTFREPPAALVEVTR